MQFGSHFGDRISPQESIDRVCDDFEAEWLKSERPRVTDFIDPLPSDLQPTLFYELMLVDLEYRHKAGKRPSRDDYGREFSQFADNISAIYLQCGEATFATIGAPKEYDGRHTDLQPGTSPKVYSASIGFRGVRSGAPRLVKP